MCDFSFEFHGMQIKWEFFNMGVSVHTCSEEKFEYGKTSN